jgi:hypothetical protein
MAGRNLKWGRSASWTDAHRRSSGHPVAVAVSSFVCGVAAGLFMREALQRTQDLVRRKRAHRERERTVTYDDNLPKVLERREPAPHEGQPRYGGTGAIGVSPSTVTPPRTEPA